MWTTLIRVGENLYQKSGLGSLQEATEEGKMGFGDAMKAKSENTSKVLSGMEDMKRPS